MGNCLNAAPGSPFDVSLLLQLRQKSLDELIECIIILKEDYPDLQCLDYSQFQDTFQHLVDDAEPFFLLLQNEKNLDGVVDVYEALAVFAIFSKDKFEKKAQFIFELFDFNANKSLELPELILTLQSVLRGLCKFVHIPPPAHKLFEEEGLSIFNKIDLDHNERINFLEFITWSDQNIDLQDFLLKYAGIQMYGHLKIGFDKTYKEYTKFFNIAGETAPEGYAKIEMLRKLIDDKEGRLLKKEDIDFLFEVMVNTTVYLSKWNVQKGGIFTSKEAYEAVIKAWCSFLASDLNRDNMLVMQELHGMLWLYDGKEPSDERVEYEMNEIRKEGCEGITIMAWMKNLCVVDKAEKYSIRPTLRHLFDKYDVDGSGYLNYDELKQIINETFRRYVEKSPNVEIRKKTEDVISKLTTEVFNGLDQNGSTNIGWEEFKKFMQVSFTKMDVMRIIPYLNFEL